jgi:hypothetical protein
MPPRNDAGGRAAGKGSKAKARAAAAAEAELTPAQRATLEAARRLRAAAVAPGGPLTTTRPEKFPRLAPNKGASE